VPLFIPPIVLPRPLAGQMGDCGLEAAEESDGLERPIAPPGRDAVADVIRPRVVSRMLGSPQEQTAVLQDPNRPWRGRHVRPLVNLVREHPECTEAKAEDGDATAPVSLKWNDEQSEDDGNRETGNLTVRVDKAPSQEIVRVEMVDAEGEEQTPADDREIVAPPGVSAPVNEAGGEVGRRHSCQAQEGDPPLPEIDARGNTDSQDRE
jgi:hypothetical protein